MESPRLIQEDKSALPIEATEERLESIENATFSQETKELGHSNSQNVKERINVENSQVSTNLNIESHDLSETTKSDRKSTEEVEDSSSQPAQHEKVEEVNANTIKNNEEASPQEIHSELKNQEPALTENKEEKIEGKVDITEQKVFHQEEIQPETVEANNQNAEETENKKEGITENKIDEVPIDDNKEKRETFKEEVAQINKDEDETKKAEEKELLENKEEHQLNNNVQESVKEKPIEETIVNTNEVHQIEGKEESQAQETVQESISKETGVLKEESETIPEKSSPKQKEKSPKIKGLRVQTQKPGEKIHIIDLGPSSAQNDGNTEIIENESNPGTITNLTDSPPSITKFYQTESLNDLIKPDTLDKSPSNVAIKRLVSASNITDKNRVSSVDEENKETQQPSSALQPGQKSGKLTMEDFHKITSIGRGSYGEVFLVKKISNNKLYALKAIDKNFMTKEKKQHQVYVEKDVLMKLNHPNIIKLFSSFQDKAKLYFVLEYVSGGEFSDYLRIHGKLSKEQIVFFAAEIVNILEYLHTFGIAHRDMKPENLLLTQEGHIKCIDFGTARFLSTEKRTADLYKKKKEEDTLEMPAEAQQKRNHRSTFVGTAQYVSPEMLEGSDCGAPADLWALGCMIYLMTVGQFPFMDINEYLIFQKIKTTTVKYPDDMDLEIKDIIQKLLVKEPLERLGAGPQGSKNDYENLKKHPFFRTINFDKLHEQKPPVVEIASPHKRKSHDPDPNLVSTPNQGRKHCHSEDLTKNDPKPNNKVFDFQTDKVRVILSGLVLKKCGWLFFKPRQLILNSKPRLVYYDPDSNQLKGEIPLAQTTKAELESKTKFLVKTPNRTFVFKEMEHSAEKWVEIINTAVQQLYSKKTGQ